ncbi:ferrochelatase [Sediminivirga luteola]|uniref:Coproporphyrin III ferrochelatase n=1 Tax=Sediminivirga luteola TaxID=1774748 RepID=A0A8J2TWN0_9MICO|nr:ferrochelatase [Sediminivirga luteola]GGA09387.1 ferrochelatase [Sediminivirga luteola]
MSSQLVPHATPAASTGLPHVLVPGRYDAVLLAGFGGPEGQDDVLPFLRRVTRGRNIPDERLEEVAQHYRRFDGVSPINAQNRALRAALQDELHSRGLSLPVYWGNRNWKPFLTDALTQAADDGHTNLLAFATSAYSSYSGCRQYREDLAEALEQADLAGRVQVDKIRQFFDLPGFVTTFAEGLRETLQELRTSGVPASAVRVLFSTHSIPLQHAENSGPPDAGSGPGGAYVAQHRAVAARIMDDLGELTQPVTWELVYQSRSGPPPQPWLEPDICDRIAELPGEGAEALVIVPLGFVSDHMEVLWDLDNEALAAAGAAGLRAVRVPTPGTHPAFVAGIADLIEERLHGEDPGRRGSLTPLGPWYDVCRPGCCLKASAPVRPAVAGLAP